MAIPVTRDPSGKPIVLGSYVRDNGYRRTGRVVGIDTGGFTWTTLARASRDGGASWLNSQVLPVTADQLRGKWIKILVHGGSSILVPADLVEVVDPFPLENDHAALYFGDPDPADLAIARSAELTQVTGLGGELRIWEPGVHGDDNERDLGRMYVLDALGVCLVVRERPDGTYVHVEDEDVIRKPLLVEVNNGGENPYGKEGEEGARNGSHGDLQDHLVQDHLLDRRDVLETTDIHRLHTEAHARETGSAVSEQPTIDNGGENPYGEEVFRESAAPGSTFETAMDRRILEEGR